MIHLVTGNSPPPVSVISRFAHWLLLLGQGAENCTRPLLGRAARRPSRGGEGALLSAHSPTPSAWSWQWASTLCCPVFSLFLLL